MKTGFCRFAGLAAGLVMLAIPIAAQTHRQKADPCKGTNITQTEMNECAAKDLRNTELKMERLLKELGIAKDSPEQKAWEAYRDAQLAAIYPQENISTYGSVYPMCLAILKKRLTEGRVRDLKALTISGEGDVCYGYRASSGKSD
jgi:uncharacterized protein YecT (DUF1311 family)